MTDKNFDSDLTRSTNGELVDGTAYPHSWSGVVLASMIIFVASYATGVGNVPWQQGELFGLEGEFLLANVISPAEERLQCAVLGRVWQPSATGPATSSSARPTSHSWTASPPPARSVSMPACVSSGVSSVGSVSLRRRVSVWRRCRSCLGMDLG